MNLPRLLVLGFLLLAYLRSPIDLLPERALGAVGLLDDLLLLIVAGWWFRAQLRRAAAARQQRTAAPPPPRPDNAAPWDPYAVLGIGRDASAADITHAYRARIKEYHPDRVADLGEDLRRLAHERTLTIQQAYEELRPARKG